MDKKILEAKLAEFIETEDSLVLQSGEGLADPNILRKVFDLLDDPESEPLTDINNTCLPR